VLQPQRGSSEIIVERVSKKKSKRERARERERARKLSSTDLDLVSAIEIVFLKKEEPGELRVRKTRKLAKKEKKGLIRFWTRLVLT